MDKKANERELAVYTLMDITELGAYNNITLRKVFNENKQLTAVQKAFVTELVNGTLRNLYSLDYIIDSFSKTKTKKMKPFILNNLRVGAYQIIYTQKIPESAACNEAVKLAKKHGFSALSGFVNGVLRSIARNKDSIAYPDEKREPVKYLSVKYSYSEEILRYWLEYMPYNTVKEMCIQNGKAPAVSLCVNTLKTDCQSLKNILEQGNVLVSQGKAPHTLRIKKTDSIGGTRAFKEGLFHIADENSVLAARVLNPLPGSSMLDVCAAPGGKSFAAAYLMENSGSITARDIYQHKLALIDEGAKRLGIDIIETQLFDAAKNTDEEKYDYVLADAPCSGLGLACKKPDIKYGKTIDDIRELAQIQRDILAASARAVKKGGYLVYSTCTVSPLENEENAKWFAEGFDFEPVDITQYLPHGFDGSSGMIQLLPGEIGTDGFFIAKFKRKG